MVHSVAPVKGSRLVEAFRFLVSTLTAGLGLIALSILVVYFCLFLSLRSSRSASDVFEYSAPPFRLSPSWQETFLHRYSFQYAVFKVRMEGGFSAPYLPGFQVK